MKMFRSAAVLALLLAAGPALAQWQTPNHTVPIGRGGGVVGFGAAAPGTAGQPIVSTGAATDPNFGQAANVGIVPGAANTLKGSLNGTTTTDAAVPSCTGATQGLKWTAGAGFSCAAVINVTGFDMPINLGLSVSSNTTALTINVTQADGTAPSAANPVVVPFRSTTATNGTVTLSSITSGLSLTIPSGATLGVPNTTPFRVWIFLAANGGTPEIGVATCSGVSVVGAGTIYPCSSWEHTLKTSLTIGAGSTSAGTLYATVGVANDAVRIIGYCDYATGLVVAGTWAGVCTTLQVMGPGIKKPGEVVQVSTVGTTTAVSTANAAFTNLAGNTISITPAATPNPIRLTIQGTFLTTGAAQVGFRWARGGVTPVGNSVSSDVTASAGQVISNILYDLPGAGTITYQVQAKTSANSVAFPAAGIGAFFEAQEIMG